MAKKTTDSDKSAKKNVLSGYIENAGLVIEQPIAETLKTNYMPYAMSVIVSRAIPEIDGFKPSHRKILYTMYKMGLLNGNRIKSANIVGQTMRLNPHGDMSIYETMVRLSRGYDALLCPFVDSKGNFGKSYSRDMAFAASRYTEAKLEKICTQIFSDIDKDTVDFVDNYDSTMKEPSLLPVTFPTILANINTGIAVGMASNIASFNLKELCNTTIARIKNPNAVILDTLKAPDFTSGGYLLYDEDELNKIYSTGKGTVRIRSKYIYDKANNCIDITEIPPTSTIEVIVDKIVDQVKSGKIREIVDVRDETDLSGLKLTIDLKRGVDADKLMQKLYKNTGLEATFSCNFNVLIGGTPQVMGVGTILDEWTEFRRGCVKRGIAFDLEKKKEKLHLLKGLKKILLDIDKAIKIIRETEEEQDVLPNLMIGFGIDEKQAEFVSEIKLRQLNREYILKRTDEIESLRDEIAEMEDTLNSKSKIDKIIIEQLKAVAKNFGQERKTEIVYDFDDSVESEEEKIQNYPVKLFFTKDGYFKKITPLSYRMSSEHKLKDGDEIITEVDSQNDVHILFFTNMGQVYKTRAFEFEDTKASVLGEYLPSKLGMDTDEMPIYMLVTSDYTGDMLFVFENGKIARVTLSSYQTVNNRKKLIKAYSVKSSLVYIDCIRKEKEILLTSSANRNLIVNTAMVSVKTTKDTQGIQAMTMKSGIKILSAKTYIDGSIDGEHRLRTKNLPAVGTVIKGKTEQLSFGGK